MFFWGSCCNNRWNSLVFFYSKIFIYMSRDPCITDRFLLVSCTCNRCIPTLCVNHIPITSCQIIGVRVMILWFNCLRMTIYPRMSTTTVALVFLLKAISPLHLIWGLQCIFDYDLIFVCGKRWPFPNLRCVVLLFVFVEMCRYGLCCSTYVPILYIFVFRARSNNLKHYFSIEQVLEETKKCLAAE